MPEIIEEQNVEKNGGHQKSMGGSRKLLQLFRLKPRKWRKNSDGNGGKKQKKSPDERRDQLDRDMKNNWEQLPATLRRRKEKLSQAVLDQFTEDVNSTEDEIKVDATEESEKQNKSADKTLDDVIHLASLEDLPSDRGPADRASVLPEPDEASVSSLQVISNSSQIIVKPQIHRECTNSSLESEVKSEENKENLIEENEKIESSTDTPLDVQDYSEIVVKKEEKSDSDLSAEFVVEHGEKQQNDENINIVSSEESKSPSDEIATSEEKPSELTIESCSNIEVPKVESHEENITDVQESVEGSEESSKNDPDDIINENSDKEKIVPINSEEASKSEKNKSSNESDSKSKTELLVSNESHLYQSSLKGEDKSTHKETPTQEDSKTSAEKDICQDNSRSRSPLSHEEQQVMALLSRAVSEDSLLIPSSPSSTSASSVTSSSDEKNDSGTDVNSPPPSTASSNIGSVSTATSRAITETLSHYQHPKKPLKSINDSPMDSDQSTKSLSTQDSSSITDSGVEKSASAQSADVSSSSTSSSPVTKTNGKLFKPSKDSDKSKPSPLYASAKSQSSSSNCCFSSLPEEPVLYEVVIPRAGYHKPSHASLKTEYQKPKDRALHDAHKEDLTCSTASTSEERSKARNHLSKSVNKSESRSRDEDDVMSYYDAVVEESQSSSSKHNDELKNTFMNLSLYPLARRSPMDSKEYEYVAKGLYFNDYVHIEMKSTKPITNHLGTGNMFAKRYAAMEFVSGFATPIDQNSNLTIDSNKDRTFTKGVNIGTDKINGDKGRWFPEVTTGKWKKPYCLETLNKKPVTMATIMEEREGEAESNATTTNNSDSEKLSVREILRRFEELGGRMQLPVDIQVECESDAEKSATLREIQETLRCLEEKVRHYETKAATTQTPHPEENGNSEKLLQKAAPRITDGLVPSKIALDAWTGHSRSPVHQPQSQSHQQSVVLQSHNSTSITQQQHHQRQQHHQQRNIITSSPQPPEPPGRHDGKHSLLQFAMLHFRQSPEKFEMLKTADGSISGSLKVIESLKTNKKSKGKKGNKENDWTWKEQVDLVKFSSMPIEQSLLRLEPGELSELAVECFAAVMRYMGDLPMAPDSTEVKCVYTILMHCHKHEALRDEVYCQLMKQTTNNKSPKPDSCQRGWRLFSIVAAYFVCSDILKPYLFKYLETAAYDKRRAYHGTATVCLQNLRKTFKYGGRKNVPSVEEITAISAGRNSKRQIYRLPGGTERVVNTKSTTVVQDVIEELCTVIGVTGGEMEMEEFSLYCIVEGDTFTMPLAREEYILDVTTELHKNQQVFYLIFCRSVWHFPLRLDSQLYVEVVFNQIAPDYLEGLLLVMPGEQLDQDIIYDIAKMAALLHRAADMTHVPTMKETKFLLPKPALTVRDVKPAQWVNMVQSNWREVEILTTIQSKAQVLDILSKWPLFGSSFFAVKRVSDPKERSDHILALNRHGVHFIDLVTHETLTHYPFSEVISTRKVKSEDGTLFLDMKCGNLMQQRITRLQTDQAHEISRLIRQYITMEQRLQQRSAA